MFEQSLVLPTPTHKRWTFAVSLTLQMAALSVLVLVPLIYTERLSQVLIRGSITAPTPPPPPPPKPEFTQAPQEMVRTIRARAVDPVAFLRNLKPRPLVDIVNQMFDPAPAAVAAPCLNCVPGSIGVVSSGLYTGDHALPLPPPPPPVAVKPPKDEAPKQIRVGGDVLAAKILRRVVPVYPPLAKQARISGVVRLQGKISREGTIIDLQVLSGHPLLIPAALDAVKQWVYRPTLLNGDPVEVVAPIDVNFTLSH